MRRALTGPLSFGLSKAIASPEGVGDIITSIFADGTYGFYFDFSKTDRLFQASIPQVAADDAGESIAYALDAHGWAGQSFPGVVAGQAEKVSNGDFSGGTTGWVSGSSYTSTAAVVSGEMQVTPTADFGRQYQTVTTVAGRAYRVTGRGRRVSGGGDPYVVINRAASQGDDLIARYFSTTSLVDFSYVFIATGTSTNILLASRTGTVGGFDDISVKEVPGNHGLQLTAAAQPKWQTGGRARFDGSDDNWLTTLMPGLAMTAILKVNASAIDDTFLGVQTDGNTRFSLGTDGSGRLGGRVGTQTFTTIFGGGDIRSTVGVAAITLDGSTVKLYWNGVEIYSGAQAGVPTTAVAIALGTYNNNGSLTTFLAGDIYHALAIKKALTAAEVAAITNLWGTS